MPMHLALTADWLPTFAGAEHVIAEFHALWPDAPMFTTVAKRSALGPIATMDIRTSTLQHWYRLIGHHQLLLPWMPAAMERMDLRGYDVILSSSHAIGKGVVPPSNATHICYCHTPMRYAWEMENEYLEDFRVPTIIRPRIKKMLKRIRRWDLTTAQRVDHFIANSYTTKERIERTYGRDATVIHPPVADHFFTRSGISDPGSVIRAPDSGYRIPDNESCNYKPSDAHAPLYFLAIGRLIPYKKFDLLIQVANAKKMPLKIAGAGPERARLERMAGPTVEFLGFVPEADLPGLYANASALLFPQLEDAGVVPLEAQACGTPVIAYGAGGALDTIIDGMTGLFFDAQSIASLSAALDRFGSMQFDRAAIRAHAEQFSSTRFRERMLAFAHEAHEKTSARRTR